MHLLKRELLPIRAETDIVLVRQAVRRACIDQRFSLIAQTKLVTAASEIARNTLEYGLGGDAALEIVSEGVRTCVRVVFTDQGPGIPDIGMALRDGYTTGGGLGHGLGGAKRLVDVFDIVSAVGAGTTITIGKWA